MKAIGLILGLVLIGCGGCDMQTQNPIPTQAPQGVGGDWAIAVERDVMCFGTMKLTQTGDTVAGIFDCGPNHGLVDGTFKSGTANLVLTAPIAALGDKMVTMPLAATLDPDGSAIHGTVDYLFAPHVDFAARRPWSF